MKLPAGLVYLAIRGVMGVISRVPGPISYRLASLLGQLYWFCAPARRRFARKTLALAFPEKPPRERDRIGRISTGNLMKVALDMPRVLRAVRTGTLGRYLDMSVASAERWPEPPFLGVTGHHGSWEVAVFGMARLFSEVHVIAKVFKNPRLQRWVQGQREAAGVFLHPRRGGIKPLARALAGGAVALQAVDQNQRRRGVFVPLFGELASTERAAVSLALRKGYPIVVGWVRRLGTGFRFRMEVSPPFVPDATGDRERDVVVAAARMNQMLEQMIRACPEQYLWIHDRYKTRPGPDDVHPAARAMMQS